jgi:hypothetical protein
VFSVNQTIHCDSAQHMADNKLEDWLLLGLGMAIPLRGTADG